MKIKWYGEEVDKVGLGKLGVDFVFDPFNADRQEYTWREFMHLVLAEDELQVLESDIDEKQLMIFWLFR